MKNLKRPLTDDDLSQIIDSHFSDGIGSDHGELSNDRQNLLDRYMGELYGDETQGESKVISRDVFETVEWAMSALVRKFTSGDRPVEFIPEDPDDEEAADQETEAVHQEFWKDNDGFTVTYLILKTLLLNPNGYVKVSRVKDTKAYYETYRDLKIEEVDMIENDPDVEIIEVTSEVKELPSNSADIPPLKTELFEIKIKRTVERGRNVVMVLPEDEVVIDGNWAEMDLDECPFACHASEKTHSELLEMGIDEKVLDDNYSKGGSRSYTAEETNRREYADETYSDDETHYALRRYDFYEAYMAADVDGDGIAEFYMVHKVGDEIVYKEPTDHQAIIAGASILLPHRHIGYSLAQTVIDLQKIRTTIWRQLLNNMYLVNNPKKKVTKGANLGDVLANRENNIFRVTDPNDVTFETPVPMVSQIAPLLNLIDNEKEMRSGVTKNATVPNEALVRESAEGTFNNLIDRADQRLDLVARLFGETVFKKIFLKLHALQLKYGDRKWLQHNGQWLEVDPSTWNRRDRVTVKIGLGFNSGDKKLAAASAIKADHDAMMAQGMMGTFITPAHIFSGRKAWLEAMGVESVDKYYINPMINPPQPKQEAPDPNLLLIQSNERIEGGKIQLKMVELQQRQQFEQMKIQAEYGLKHKQLEREAEQDALKAEIDGYKTQLQDEQAMNKDEIERLKLKLSATEKALEDSRHDADREMRRYEAELKSATQILLKQMDQGTADDDEVEVDRPNYERAISELQNLVNQMGI